MEHHENLNAEDLRARLDDCLSNIQSSGSFALFAHLKNPPNPGLHLKNGGTIGLPLSDRDAEVIIAASHAAPFGKGEETIVDSSVRKTWELSPTDFGIRNPAWQEFLKSIVAQVSAGLGVDMTGDAVSAELYKLLLYDEGAMFKAHQDSEKAPRMFATLVIALPSKHDGGEVRVTHSGKTKVFATSKVSEFNASFLAWFADVTHEVRPVLAGRRLVLTYNLIHTTLGARELSATSNKAMTKLRPLLSSWKDNIDKDLTLPTRLAFLLEHQYTDASLCFDGLKGHDRQVATHLREACIEYGFCLYLANIERSIEGGCDGDSYAEFHEITSEIDRQTSLKRVVELDGKLIAEELDFDENLFIQQDPFNNKQPDEEDYSGYTGNEGVSATHFYRRTVILILPRSKRIEFLFSPSTNKDHLYTWSVSKLTIKTDVVEWIDRIQLELVANQNDESALDELRQICTMVIRQTKTWKLDPAPLDSWRRDPAPFSDEVVARVVIAALELDSEALFLDAIDIYSGNGILSPYLAAGVALLRYRQESLLSTLERHLLSHSTLSRRVDIIEEIGAGLKTESQRRSENDARYQDWLKQQADLALSSDTVSKTSDKDGIALVHLSKRMPSQELFKKILPIVKSNVINTTMAVAFLTGLFKAGVAGEVPEDVTQTIFHDIITDLADSFTLSFLSASLEKGNKKSRSVFVLTSSTAPEPLIDHLNSHTVAELLLLCQRLQFHMELESIVAKLVLEARTAPLDLFPNMYLPFLKILLQLLEGQNITIGDSPFPRLFQQILSKYLVRFVRLEPLPPKDWKRPTVNCACQDCQSLNRFLASPVEMVGRFAVNKKRRQHLHNQLNGTGCTHETERHGSPQTLVVTKNQKLYLVAHNDWSMRHGVANKHLQELRKDTMKDLLADMYEPIMSLSVNKIMQSSLAVEGSNQTSTLAPSNTASNRLLPPTKKRKVSPEVIIIN